MGICFHEVLVSCCHIRRCISTMLCEFMNFLVSYRKHEVLMLGLGWCKSSLALETIGLPTLWLELLMKKLHMWLSVSSGLFRFVSKWDASPAQLSEVHLFVCVCVCVFKRCRHSLASLVNSPISSLADLLEEYNVELKGPFNHLARDEAGLPREW